MRPSSRRPNTQDAPRNNSTDGFPLAPLPAEEQPQVGAVERLILGIPCIAPHARHHARGRNDELGIDREHGRRHLFDQLVKGLDSQPFDLIFMGFVKFLAVLQSVELQQVDARGVKAVNAMGWGTTFLLNIVPRFPGFRTGFCCSAGGKRKIWCSPASGLLLLPFSSVLLLLKAVLY